jgi:hypothetical protein
MHIDILGSEYKNDFVFQMTMKNKMLVGKPKNGSSLEQVVIYVVLKTSHHEYYNHCLVIYPCFHREFIIWFVS